MDAESAPSTVYCGCKNVPLSLAKNVNRASFTDVCQWSGVADVYLLNRLIGQVENPKRGATRLESTQRLR